MAVLVSVCLIWKKNHDGSVALNNGVQNIIPTSARNMILVFWSTNFTDGIRELYLFVRKIPQPD